LCSAPYYDIQFNLFINIRQEIILHFNNWSS